MTTEEEKEGDQQLEGRMGEKGMVMKAVGEG